MGDAALAVGLVDRLGGLDAALALARAEVKGPVDDEPRVMVGRLPSHRDNEPEVARAIAALLPPRLTAALLPVVTVLEERVAAITLVAPPT
jgi:ClpP class serine protease